MPKDTWQLLGLVMVLPVGLDLVVDMVDMEEDLHVLAPVDVLVVHHMRPSICHGLLVVEEEAAQVVLGDLLSELLQVMALT